MPSPRIVILGAGLIGTSFAAVFRDAGAAVTLIDPDAAKRAAAPEAIEVQAEAIVLSGQARGLSGSVEIAAALPEPPMAADLVIECGPERLEAKQAIFADLLERTAPPTILATASSAIPLSRILPDAADQARALVAHPVNPPAVLRLIELCPAPGTLSETTRTASALFEAAGFAPVVLGHEIEGFVLNRLQGAVLREAYRLVDEGVIDAAGLDRVMTTGLGPRWALSGPFETADLNAPGGLRDHAARMGPAYRRMGEARGETVDWPAALVERVAAAREALLPPDLRPARRAWRARAVARLVAARDRISGGDDEA